MTNDAPVPWLDPEWLDPERLPPAADAEREAVGFRRWVEVAKANPLHADWAAATADRAETRALLSSLFGNSPFLTNALLADLGFARTICTHGPAAATEQAIARLAHAQANQETTEERMRRLRIGKREAALAIAIADIAGVWPLETVTERMSDLAEAAIGSAVAHLLSRDAAAGRLRLRDDADPEAGSGLIVLGMGKLGARELNYSSDIDLIVLFDRERAPLAPEVEPQEVFVKLTRALVRMLDERTRDGYVFRTDLRLRPDPGATPVAISTLAAETYYESAGQNWERAAMIKARTVAGDRAAGDAFLEGLRPFLWRKHLDFAAIQDIHSIKRQIHAHRGGARIAIGGHNIKLGRGGIREIEFFAQTQQLIWGGREVTLRVRGTCAALAALAEAGHIAPETVADLAASYAFLRTLEHRLQMVDDQQTHTLPKDDAGLAAIARFLGFTDSAQFTAALLSHLHTVEDHYAALFEESAELGHVGNLVFTGAEDDPDTVGTLTALGYRDPQAISTAIRGWHHGRCRATRSARARELLTELMPALLRAFAATSSPDAALLRFNEFLNALPAGVQILSLFHSNPGLLDLLAEIMGSAPRLGVTLARNPALLDGVLSAQFAEPVPPAGALAAEVAQGLRLARDFQDTLDIVRRWTNDRTFQIGVQILRAAIDPEQAGPPFSAVAETALGALYPAVAEEFAAQHGNIAGAEMAVLALGKLGGHEMTVGSDLDLVFIYDNPDGVEESDGARPLHAGTYFARLAQRYINAITAPTGEGRLYEVDMRLRPSGNAGPVATSVQAFRRYHEESAWTWEKMALTRGRVIVGSQAVRAHIETMIRDILSRSRDADALLADVADMRARILRERGAGGPWRVKDLRGGLVDIEFIAQYLQLRHAAEAPGVLATNTTVALDRLAGAGFLDVTEAAQLIGAMHLWRRLQGILRLTVGDDVAEDAVAEGPRATIARAAGVVDFPALREMIEANSQAAYAVFERLIEAPASQHKAENPQPGKDARS